MWIAGWSEGRQACSVFCPFMTPEVPVCAVYRGDWRVVLLTEESALPCDAYLFTGATRTFQYVSKYSTSHSNLYSSRIFGMFVYSRDGSHEEGYDPGYAHLALVSFQQRSKSHRCSSQTIAHELSSYPLGQDRDSNCTIVSAIISRLGIPHSKSRRSSSRRSRRECQVHLRSMLGWCLLWCSSICGRLARSVRASKTTWRSL
jgi:hypothetical protein